MVGQVEGQRRLADALRPGKEQRVRQLAGPIGGRQHACSRFVADQTWVFRRLGNAVQGVVLFGRDAFEHHASPDTALIGLAPRLECSEHSGGHRVLDRFGVRRTRR